LNYDEINFFGSDIQKPPKEEFEAKLKELIDAQPLEELRQERDKCIAKTDYLFTSDYPHASEEVRQAWLDYRQALRDLPANPVWPVRPDEVVPVEETPTE
jgi:hypothetical protein